MSFAPCDDLRIGGTLTGPGITGGISIQNTRMMVADWSGIFGHVGHSLKPLQIAGRPGVVLTGDGLPLARQIALPLVVTNWNEQGARKKSSASFGGQLWDNTDLLASYLANRAGFYLEVDHPDLGSRFAYCYAMVPAGFTQMEWRRATIPMTAPWPYWKEGGAEFSLAGSGAAVITVLGDVPIWDPVLSFSAAGTYTNSTAGWTIVTSGACVVDVGARRITVAGVDSDNLLTSRTHREIAWFEPGANSVTRSVSVTTTFRNQYGI